MANELTTYTVVIPGGEQKTHEGDSCEEDEKTGTLRVKKEGRVVCAYARGQWTRFFEGPPDPTPPPSRSMRA
jgi:hypothetical protein